MGVSLDPNTREDLEHVLFYLLESEANRYYQLSEHERMGHVYTSARALMQHFGFENLLKTDAALWQSVGPNPSGPHRTERKVATTKRYGLIAKIHSRGDGLRGEIQPIVGPDADTPGGFSPDFSGAYVFFAESDFEGELTPDVRNRRVEYIYEDGRATNVRLID